MFYDEPFDCIVQPIRPQTVISGHSFCRFAHLRSWQKNRVDILRAWARLIDQTHYRAVIETNLPPDAHPTQFVTQRLEVFFDLLRGHTRPKAYVNRARSTKCAILCCGLRFLATFLI